MPDDMKKDVSEGTKPAETVKNEPIPEGKTWIEAELKKVIAQRDEVKKELRAIEEREKAAAEKRMTENEEWKKLAEQRKAELDELQSFKAKASEQDAVISKLLKDSAAGLDDDVADAILSNPIYKIEEKIEKINAIKSKLNIKKESPASDTPSFATGGSQEEFFKKLLDNSKHNSNELVDLSIENKPLFNAFIEWRKKH